MIGWNILHCFLNLNVFPLFAVGSCAAHTLDPPLHLSAEFYSGTQCFQGKEAHYLQKNVEKVKSKLKIFNIPVHFPLNGE